MTPHDIAWTFTTLNVFGILYIIWMQHKRIKILHSRVDICGQRIEALHKKVNIAYHLTTGKDLDTYGERNEL